MSVQTKSVSRIEALEKELSELRASETLKELEGKGVSLFKAEIAAAKNFEECRKSAQRFISKVNNARARLPKQETE